MTRVHYFYAKRSINKINPLIGNMALITANNADQNHRKSVRLQKAEHCSCFAEVQSQVCK